MREYVVRVAQRQLVCLAFAGTLALPLYLVTPSSPQAQVPARTAEQVIGFARVVDGDTIVINDVRVRLEGIDAPESTQACGKPGPAAQAALPFGAPQMLGRPELSTDQWACGRAAANHLNRLIGRSEVRCDDFGLDKYGRLLGRCFAGTANLNAAMVRDGYAWAYVKYSQAYVTLEADARASGVGIWQGPAIPPWDYRKRTWETAEAVAPAGCTIKGNVSASGKVYHMPWNTWYDKVRMEPGRANSGELAGGKRWFCNEQDALDAGWRPASPQ